MKNLLLRTAGTLALGLALLGSPRPVQAADPPAAQQSADHADRLAAATKLVETMHLDQQFDALLPQVIDAMMSTLVRGNTGREELIRQILTEEFMTAFAAQRPAMLTIYREIYARNLTLAELEAMDRFYKTPIGQSVLSKTSKLTQDGVASGMDIGRKAAMAAMPQIFQRMQAAKLTVPKGV
jgi:hypothetical protein